MVRDPREGVAPDGSIVTGADRRAVPPEFEPVLAALSARLAEWPAVTAYLYGSVATGQARAGRSDVDVLTVGLPEERALSIGSELSGRFADLCREVAIAAASPDDLTADGDEAYGMRVFVKHYCTRLSGPDRARGLPRFRADASAARGFNGDVDRHLATWRRAVDQRDPELLGRQVARKTLLAAAGLVSVLDSTWTTDRELAVDRWASHRPEAAAGLRQLRSWAAVESSADHESVVAVLAPGGLVEQVVEDFRAAVGLWSPPRR